MNTPPILVSATRRMAVCPWVVAGGLALLAATAAAQPAVVVTMALDDNQIGVGESTVLRVFARVAPAYQAGSDRIFSWYVDLLAASAGAVACDFNALTMAASDSPDGSGPFASRGTTSGGNRTGIFNTFMNRAGAGVAAPVELLAVTVHGTAAGQAVFTVRAGTGVPAMAHDFQVVPTGGGAAWTGGDYTTASATLTVASGGAPDVSGLRPKVQRVSGMARVLFTPKPGFTHVVEYSNTLGGGTWTALPGTPHNSGSVDDASSLGVPRRFYRVKVSP